MKNKISTFMRIAISFGLLGFLFWLMRNEVSDIASIVFASNLKLIAVAVGLNLVNVFALAYRLKIIFSGENLSITLRKAMQLTLIGYFFNNFMPTAVGGDVIKAHYAALDTRKRIQSYASVFMDRIIGLYTFLAVAAVALVVDRGRFDMPMVKPAVYCLVALGILGFLIATNKTISQFVGRLLGRVKMFNLGKHLSDINDIVYDYRNRLDVVAKAFLVSIFAQCLYFGVVYLFFLSLGVTVNLGNIFLIMPIVIFISMIPSLGGLGVREGAIVMLFAPLAGKEAAFAVSMLVLFVLFLIGIAGGIVYLCKGATETGNKGLGTETIKEQ